MNKTQILSLVHELRSNKRLTILLSTLLISTIFATGYFFCAKDTETKPVALPESVPEVPESIDQQEVSTTSIEILPDDGYELFVLDEYSKEYFMSNYNQLPTVEYTEYGTITSGAHSGYHLLVARASYPDEWSENIFVFATKDYNSFVVNTSSVVDFNVDENLNKNKIVSVDDILKFPKTITIGNFVLVQESITFIETPSDSKRLFDVSPGFKLYTNTYGTDDLSGFVSGNSDVLVVDDVFGLTMKYAFLTTEQYERSEFDVGNYGYDFDFYKNSDIETDELIYTAYSQLSPPYGCGHANRTDALQNISLNDLVQIGETKNGVDLYTFKDSNHPINIAHYDSKVTRWKDMFFELNEVEAPSYEEYVSKNPVLIFKDSLGRWVGVGEWEYQTGGGCGKPVVYLYPEEPTEVSVEFANPMRFTVAIPAYAGQWNVRAYPDGSLVDLQPEKTNCGEINFSRKGSEYAKDACEKNMYPYLYWAGYTTNAYPSMEKGWIVPSGDTENFLDEKLSEMGLHENEKADFLEYWVPKMLSKKTPYYRVSFFQTNEMNTFVPMDVSPKPDTALRIFLDWEPLSALPDSPIEPQVLDHVERKGFTLVEWGGINR